jgi:hypothetical protein
MTESKKEGGVVVSLGRLSLLYPILNKLLSQDIPVVPAYELSKIVKKMREEVSMFEDMRNRIVVKHGSEKYEKDGEILIPVGTPEHDNYVTEITPLAEKEISFDLVPVSVKDLGKDCKMRPDELAEIPEFVTR